MNSIKLSLILFCICNIFSYQVTAQAAWTNMTTTGTPALQGLSLATGDVLRVGTATGPSGLVSLRNNRDNSNLVSLLRLEQESLGGEANIRFRSKDNGGGILHADIALNAQLGILGFKVPFNNTVGQGYVMAITDQGDVGINTTSPTQRLHVRLNSNETVRFENLPNGSGNLVVIDGNGNLAVCANATCSSRNEANQQDEIKVLKEKVEKLEKILLSLTKDASHLEEPSFNEDKNKSTLFQNAPNPFSDHTTINYFLTETDYNENFINIYNLNGQLIETFKITKTGHGQIEFNSKNYTNGTYFYKLATNGKVIDAKKMIIAGN